MGDSETAKRESRIQAVIFDLDGTLYHQRPVRRAMLLRLIRAYATTPVTGYRTIRYLEAFRREQEALRTESTLDAAQQQLDAACRRTGMQPHHGAELVTRWMHQEPLDLLFRHRREGVEQLLAEIRTSGRRLGVLSDYPAEEKLAALGIRQWFDVVVCAQDPEVGAFKPSPLGLHVLLQRLAVEPVHALYVGDRPEVDYVAAKAAGVACAIFSPSPAAAEGFTPIATCRELQSLLLG